MEEKKVAVKVTADGKTIPMKGFIQGFIAYSILGMLKSLRGTPADPKEIIVNIKCE